MPTARIATWFCMALLCAPAAFATAAAETDTGGSPRDLNRLADADRAAYHGRYTDAIARATGVIDGRPHFAAAYYERADFYVRAALYTQALGDLDRVIAMHPDTAGVYIVRANIALRQRRADQALAELSHAASLPTQTFWKQSYEASHNDTGGGHGIYLSVSIHDIAREYAFRSLAHELLKQDDAALADLQHALDNEPLYPWRVLAYHCYVAAVAGLLDMAELTCGEAIARQTHDDGVIDTMGFVHIKMHKWDSAIADYNRALAARPDLTVALYGRGVARRAKGDTAGDDADIAAARRDEPDISGIMGRLGVPGP